MIMHHATSSACVSTIYGAEFLARWFLPGATVPISGRGYTHHHQPDCTWLFDKTPTEWEVGNAAQHIAVCTCTKTSEQNSKGHFRAFCFFKFPGKADLQANKTTILRQVTPFSLTSSSIPSGCCGAQLSTAESHAPARWLRQTCFLVSSCQSKNQENRKCTKWRMTG